MMAFNVSVTDRQTKAGFTGNQPGASTYLGEKCRGGWKPVLLELPDCDKPIIIDWFCPTCQAPIYTSNTGSHKCLRCGLKVLDVPIVWERATRSKRIRGWCNFIDENKLRIAYKRANASSRGSRAAASLRAERGHIIRHRKASRNRI